MGVCSAQEGAVHDQRELAVGEQGKQDVCDVLRSQLSVVKDPGDRAGFGFETGVPGQMERDLPVQRRFGLKQRQEHFGQTPQGIKAAMREVGFQVGGQRVSMQAGGIADRHRPRYRPLSCRTASRTPFAAKCQVLRSTPFHALSAA